MTRPCPHCTGLAAPMLMCRLCNGTGREQLPPPPTVREVIAYPFALLYMGVTAAAVALAAFLLNPRGDR